MAKNAVTNLEQARKRFLAVESTLSSFDTLQLDALYAQATQGDVKGKRPGFTDFADRMRYDAWARLQGKSKEAAMSEFIDWANNSFKDRH